MPDAGVFVTEMGQSAEAVLPHMVDRVWPERWLTTRLSDESIFSIESGTWVGEKEPLVECAVIRNTNFTDDGSLDLSDVAIILIEQRQLDKKQLAWGDIIIERSGGGPKQPVGRVAFFDVRDDIFCFSNFTSRVRVLKPDVMDARFLHLYLHYFHLSGQTEMLQRRTTGIRNLAFADYKSVAIPLPGLPEQLAIVSVLSTAQEAIHTRQRELDLERERKAALLKHLFTHGAGRTTTVTKQTRFGWVPEHWSTMLLDECAHVQTGVAKGRKLSGGRVVSLPYLRVANVQDGYLDLSEIKTIDLLESEVDRYRLQPGDVVVTEGGDFDKLGRGYLWQGQVPNCVHQNHIFAVRVDHALLLPEYFAFLIQSAYGKAYFLNVAHRTTNLASINSTKLKAFPVLVPPMQEQRDIVAILDACDVKIAAIGREVAMHEELFQVLLEELMSGRISALALANVAGYSGTNQVRGTLA